MSHFGRHIAVPVAGQVVGAEGVAGIDHPVLTVLLVVQVRPVVKVVRPVVKVARPVVKVARPVVLDPEARQNKGVSMSLIR